ncbi:hypothetical protein RHGRI_038671 [Rhododendron griersonianum]|uniref:PB1 domain-containing protein n=1 Tax=Rhododendron griersonianum TaxID=479676 RepID=A0AAV6HMF0_9ERIC|nr:hypothetical protein RHGRI_038671 [Rhododendron griersonianum]
MDHCGNQAFNAAELKYTVAKRSNRCIPPKPSKGNEAYTGGGNVCSGKKRKQKTQEVLQKPPPTLKTQASSPENKGIIFSLLKFVRGRKRVEKPLAEEKDMREGSNGECLTESDFSFDGSPKVSLSPDFDGTENKEVKVYRRRGKSWHSMKLKQPATFAELGMDPENEGIISDMLRFVSDKEIYRKEGKPWKRGYLLFYSPGTTDRSSLIAAMANRVEFDIYDLNLTGLTSISELMNVLVSIKNRSLIAIKDFDHWAGKLPYLKNELTLSVWRPPDQHGEGNTSTTRETPSHNVQTGMEGEPVGENAGSSFEWASQVNDQSTLSTPDPNHDALVFPPPQMTLLASENRGGSIDLMNSVASQAEPFSDRHISGFSNFATCSDQAAPSQHVGGQAMQSTDHNAFVFPQTQMVSPQEPFLDFTEGSIPLNTENGLIIGIVKIPLFHDSYPGNYPIDYKERENAGSSSGWASRVNDQSTLSTPYPNHDALVFPPPQMTSLPSENRGGSIDLMNSVASQAEPFSDRHISGFSNFATSSDHVAPSQHVGGQAMQSTDHNAFVFPQTLMVSPQEPFPDFMEGSIPLNTENGLIIGSSSGWASRVNDQSTLSTPYPNHDALVFPPPQMTSFPSENRGCSIDLMNSVASQAEPFSDRHISGFSNFATSSDHAAPSQHVGGQAMQFTDHNAFVFPQTQMVSPQEPFPAGHVFEFSNWNKHTNSVKIKAFYGEAIYKFWFPLTSGIDDLKKEVSKRRNVEVDRFEVKYKDEHGDLISLP